jgi:hypothetical protein
LFCPLDISGVEWSNVSPEQIDCILRTVNSLELIGDENDLYGFVGTTYLKDVVGGFFMIQFPTELLSYTLDKVANRETTKPAERVFFALLPKYGKILLQNRHFEVLPISMDAVHRRLQDALSRVLKGCKVGIVISLSPTTSLIGKTQLLEFYRGSRRVSRIKVHNPNVKTIPKDLDYYNPRRERNEIIRDSRTIDYPKLKSLDIKAKDYEDLRDTHLGKDLIYTVTDSDPFIMEFDDQKEKRRIVRRTAKRTPLEFHIDVSTDQVSQQTLMQVIEILEREAALDISVIERALDSKVSSDQQMRMSFFDDFEDEEIEDDDE